MRRHMMFVPLLLLALSTFTYAGAAQEATPCPPPAEEELESIARQYFDTFNTGDTDALDELLAPDYSHDGAIGPEQDRELHKERVRITKAGFPDVQYTIDQIMTDGDLVLVRWTFKGTHEGEYAGLAPTGVAVEVTGIHIHRIECGQIVETWNEGDALALYQQIGLVPTATGATPAAPTDTGSDDVSASPVSCPALTDAEGQDIVHRWFDEVWSEGNVDGLDEMLTDNHVHHWAIGPDSMGIDQARQRITALGETFIDLEMTIDGTLIDGDFVAAWWTATGTAGATLQGMPTNGEPFVLSGINIFHIECGRIAESWSEADYLGLFRQLGLAPDSAATPSA